MTETYISDEIGPIWQRPFGRDRRYDKKRGVPNTLFQKKKDLPCEPDGIGKSPSFVLTRNIQKLVRSKKLDGVTRIDLLPFK